MTVHLADGRKLLFPICGGCGIVVEEAPKKRGRPPKDSDE